MKLIEVVGERLWLLPARALFQESKHTLFVADVHFGKTAAMRAMSFPVPGGTTASDLARLSDLLNQTRARSLVVLGDLLHARQGRAPSTLAAVSEWRRHHADVRITLVRGNHDRRAGDPPSDWDVECVSAPFRYDPFVLCHHPCVQPEGYVLAGHIHPAVQLRGSARDSVRLACFHIMPDTAVLPAFGSFTGTADVQRIEGDRVFAIAGNEIIEL